MQKHNCVDIHLHSSFSVDSQASIESMCESAINKNCLAIAFTEHFDLNPNDDGFGYFDSEAYSKAIESARKKYSKEIKVLKGIEFSEPHLYKKEFQAFVDSDYDVIICSVHWVGGFYAGGKDFLEHFGLRNAFAEYYKIVLKAVEYGGFDVLGHFDFPKRYFKENVTRLTIIDEILERLVESEIALEINSSPLRKGFPETCPDKEIIERYSGLGGKKVTFGSDAHVPEDIGKDFEYVLNLLNKFPELKIGYFEKRTYKQI